jgi:DNA-binding transcriptional MerR regulator
MTPHSDSKWTLYELVAKANQSLPEQSSQDSRLSKELTARNLRRLVEQGAIDPPSRIGREAYYGPSHLEQALQARELMGQGFAASSVKTLREASKYEHNNDRASKAIVQDISSSNSMFASTCDAGLDAPYTSQSAPSTQSALSFLNSVAKAESTSASSRLAQPLGSAFAAASSLSGLASRDSASFSLSQAYQGLTSSPLPAKHASATFETEPFPGTRVSVRSDCASQPLTTEQKSAALAAFEQAWAQALAANAASRKAP